MYVDKNGNNNGVISISSPYDNSQGDTQTNQPTNQQTDTDFFKNSGISSLSLKGARIRQLGHFWPIQKWQPPKIDACGVALGKRDLMQQSEWKKLKN